MKLITDGYEGDLLIDGYVAVSGVVFGSVEVAAGRFTLTGEVRDDVVVHDGVANIYGRVHGDIISHGGKVIVAGDVDGRLRGGRFMEVTSSAVIGHNAQPSAVEPVLIDDGAPSPSATPSPAATLSPIAASASRAEPQSAHAKWRRYNRSNGISRPVLPWNYAPASPNPRLRIIRWRRFVTAVILLAIAVALLFLAAYLGGRNPVPQANAQQSDAAAQS